MADAVVVSTARTAIGTAVKGSLVDVDAFELGPRAVSEAMRRSGVDPVLVDDAILGESLYGGGDIAPYAAIEAGLDHVAGVAHNRHCASGLAAVTTAAASIKAGTDRVVVAGGAHSSSTSPRATRRSPARTIGATGCRPPTGTVPRRPTSTCPSWSAGTRRSKPTLGVDDVVAAMCAGGGMSAAVVLDVPAP